MSASTIKAPFLVSLAEQYPEKIAEHPTVMEAVAKQSSKGLCSIARELWSSGYTSLG
ncbi:hypothetical protein ACERC8_00525 [Streptococcus sp. E29BA]|uniref:hypothetical protein n=1 Tax=Streptococcus sp. E29BA TaxID=3278716 RepID=UPI00359D7E31